jgi:hypothetical protein
MSHRPVRRRRSPPGEQGFHWAWLVIGLICVAVIGVAIVATISVRHAAHVDSTTFCDTKGPSAVTVVLVDATDTITPVQRMAIANRLTRLSADMRANERLAIFEIVPGRNDLVPSFSRCRPATAAETSQLTGNRRLAAERFDKAFKPAVDHTVESLLQRAPAEASPIMEGVQAASVAALQTSDLAPDAPRRLIVISDMLQNSPVASHYQGVPDFSKFRSSPAFAKVRSDLSGVDVVLLYLRRDNAENVQGLNHVDFWSRWFSDQGAEDFRAIPIEG